MQKYLCRRLACACVRCGASRCLSLLGHIRRAPRGILHGSILFATTRRQCQPCAAYRAKGSGSSVCVLSVFSVFCFPRRAPGGGLCESSIRRQQQEMRRDIKGGGDAIKRLKCDVAFVNSGVYCLAVHTQPPGQLNNANAFFCHPVSYVVFFFHIAKC